MRLVVTFPQELSPMAVARIRDTLDRASPEEWRPLVLEMGGIVYDLDQPLTIVLDGSGRTVVEQTPPEEPK